ncbi:MAG: MauE/DoxX family redox-associated membrane protein, partial [Gemmatimonadaceae bacterium]
MTLGFEAGPSAWLTIGPRLVGATFIYTGIIKAIAPHTFQNHLSSLGYIPWKLQRLAVTAAAGAEAAWGVALLAGAAPALFYPATIVLLAVLTSISWWGVRSGKAKDCGCYGGYMQPSIKQSIAINATLVALIVIAWKFTSPSMDAALWQITLVVAAGIALAGLTETAQRFESTTGKPMIDTNPLKVGEPWKHRWADGATAGMDGEVLIAYLGPNCPYCSQFVKVANAMVQSPTLPRVIGVMSAPDPQVAEYVKNYEVRFPVVTVS